jgi:hypothetical protein
MFHLVRKENFDLEKIKKPLDKSNKIQYNKGTKKETTPHKRKELNYENYLFRYV